MARSRSARTAPEALQPAACAIGPAAVSAALQLHLLTETSRLFSAPLSLAAILREFVGLIAGNLDLAAVLLLLREEGAAEYPLRAAKGVPRGAPRSAAVPGDDPLIAQPSAGGGPLLVSGLARDRRWRRSRLRPLLPETTESLLVLPLAMQGRVRGLLVLAPARGANSCTVTDLEWFLPVAEQLSLALEKLELTQRLERASRDLEGTVRTRTSELRKANSALRASLAEVRELRLFSDQVIASLASGLVTFDGAGRVMTANPPAQSLLQLGGAPPEGRTLSDVFGKAFADALLGRLGGRKERIARAQATVTLGTGEEKVIGYSVSPLRHGRSGRSWVLLFRDLTDSQRLNSELRRLDRLVSLGEISANVAHELKNPLTVMYANMEWLLEKLPEEFRRRIQITIEHMERMEAIVARMGLLSKDQPLVARPIDLGDLVTQMLAFVDKTLREKRIDVAVAVRRAPAWISGDPAQLQQALLNVIMNAAQAIDTNGLLTVRLERRAHRGCPGIELAVEDSGPGIPPHLLGRIFEPFFTTKETGTGLGLAITSQIVAAHKGRILAENLAGGGARVRIWFPGSGTAPRRRRPRPLS